MTRADAKEASGIVERMLVNLLATISQSGRAGSDARTTINETRVNALALLMADNIGPSLDECFDLARQAGTTLPQIDSVRAQIALETPKTLGGNLLKQSGINFCLAMAGYIIAEMEFVSRETVDRIKTAMLPIFADAEEAAADAMVSELYRALIGLHASINAHLVATARPLPRMLGYQFFEPLPTLVMSYRLYDSASRADEIRDENKIVHPAFSPLLGKALSA